MRHTASRRAALCVRRHAALCSFCYWAVGVKLICLGWLFARLRERVQIQAAIPGRADFAGLLRLDLVALVDEVEDLLRCLLALPKPGNAHRARLDRVANTSTTGACRGKKTDSNASGEEEMLKCLDSHEGDVQHDSREKLDAPDVVHHLQAGVDLQGAGGQLLQEPRGLHDALDGQPLSRVRHQHLLQQVLALL